MLQHAHFTASFVSSGLLLVVAVHCVWSLLGIGDAGCACMCACALAEHRALALSYPSLVGSSFSPILVCSALLSFLPNLSVIMAVAPAGCRHHVTHAEDGDQGRSVRACNDDAETRLDSVESTLGRHEARFLFVEAPLRVVLRGYTSVQEFLRVLREHDMRRSKTAFIPSLCDELRDKCGPEVHRLVEEAGNLLVDRQARVGGDRCLPDMRYVG